MNDPLELGLPVDEDETFRFWGAEGHTYRVFGFHPATRTTTQAAHVRAGAPEARGVELVPFTGMGSPLELRAKVRRLKADAAREQASNPEYPGLGLVVIDYLQLMSGRKGVASREQEVSELSRGLKQLAKELEVPVIALSKISAGCSPRPDSTCRSTAL